MLVNEMVRFSAPAHPPAEAKRSGPGLFVLFSSPLERKLRVFPIAPIPAMDNDHGAPGTAQATHWA
jgi:hypothetical protein